MLCSHSEQDIERRDKCNRTIHDVATDDCKDLLENLRESLHVCVCVLCLEGDTQGLYFIALAISLIGYSIILLVFAGLVTW